MKYKISLFILLYLVSITSAVSISSTSCNNGVYSTITENGNKSIVFGEDITVLFNGTCVLSSTYNEIPTNWRYNVSEEPARYNVTRLDDQIFLLKNYGTYSFEKEKISFSFTITPSQLGTRSTQQGTFWYIVLPQELKGNHFKWDFKNPEITNQAGDILNESSYEYRNIGGQRRLYYNQEARNFGLVASTITFTFNSWTVGSGGNAWAGNTSGDNTNVTGNNDNNIIVAQAADYFNRANSSDEGENWYDSQNYFAILNNRLNVNFSSNSYPLLYSGIPLTSKNYTILFRYIDTNTTVTDDRFFVIFNSDSYTSPSSNVPFLEFREGDGRIFAFFANFSYKGLVNVGIVWTPEFDIQMDIKNTNVTVYQNGVLKGNIDLWGQGSSQTGTIGFGGFLSSQNNLKAYDNVTIKKGNDGNRSIRHDAGSGNEPFNLKANFSFPPNTNATVTTFNNATGAFLESWSSITSSQWTQALTSKPQDIKVNVTLFGNLSATAQMFNFTIETQTAIIIDRPNITSWGNNKSDNLSLDITINTSENIKFNVTSNYSVIDTWAWAVNGSDQSVNFDNYTSSWTTNGLRTISVSATNITNGTSDTITWNLSIINQPLVATPNITSWGNNKTSNQSVNISINTTDSLNLNITSNQSLTTYSWFINTTNQNNNFDNLTISYTTAGLRTIKVNGTNDNGTTQTIEWGILIESFVTDCTDEGSDGIVDNIIVVDSYSNCRTDGYDDQQQIQDAVNNSVNGTTIYLNGTYYNITTQGNRTFFITPLKYSVSLFGLHNVTIKGNGVDTTILNATNYNTLDLFIGVQNSTNITIKDIYLSSQQPTRGIYTASCPGCSSGTWNTTMLYLFNVSNSTFNNILFKGGTGLYGSLVFNTTFSNNNITAESGFDIGGSSIWSTYSEYNHILNNTFYVRSDGQTGIRLEGAHSYTNITNNTIHGSSGQGYMIDAYSGSKYNTVSNNTLIGNNANFGIGIRLSGDNAVLNNTISAIRDSGIEFIGSGNLLYSNIIIRGNKIYDVDAPYTSYALRNESVGGITIIGDIRVEGMIIEQNSISKVYQGITIHSLVKGNITVTNNIVTNGSQSGLHKHASSTAIINNSYNLIWNFTENLNGTTNGTGDLYVNPLFTSESDFHLKSTTGRWNGAAWVVDTVHSPAIDAGDPASIYSNEPSPNGGRINMGAYGNTVEASKSSTSTLPIITSWSNNITSNESFNISINTSIPINLNFTANQSLTIYNWYVNGTDQSNNYDNITVSWSTVGLRTVTGNGSNDNGTTTNSTVWYLSVEQGVITSTYIPPSPINLTNTTGPNWINYSFEYGTGNNTDSVNISQNSTWTNGTTALYYNSSVGAHGYSNILIQSFNNTGTGNINITGISDNVSIPNNPISISNVSTQYNTHEGLVLIIDADYSDPDLDTGTFGINTVNGSLNTATGVWQWTPTSTGSGDYNLTINVSDGYGSVSSTSFNVTVADSNPATVNYTGSTQGNFWINHTFLPGETNLVATNVTNSNTNDNSIYTAVSTPSGTKPLYSTFNNAKVGDFVWIYAAIGGSSGTYLPQIKNQTSGIYENTISWTWEDFDFTGTGWKQIEITSSHYIPVDTYNYATNVFGLSSVIYEVQLRSTASTSSFNVSHGNGSHTNGSAAQFSNNTFTPHIWYNITICGYNSTLSVLGTCTSSNVQIANNVPVQSAIGDKTINESELLTINVATTDADTDTLSYGTNATKGSLNPSTGVFTWTPTNTESGIYVWYFNSSDTYGGLATETITITVNDTFPAPNTTSWSNNITANQTDNISIDTTIPINFNITVNQSITTYAWFVDTTDQSNNFDNITLSWSTSGTRSILSNATNQNGTTQSIQWNITVFSNASGCTGLNKQTDVRIYINGSTTTCSNGTAVIGNISTRIIQNSTDDWYQYNVSSENSTYISFNESSNNESIGIEIIFSNLSTSTNYTVTTYWSSNGTKIQDFHVLTNTTGHIRYNTTGIGTERYTIIQKTEPVSLPKTLVVFAAAVIIGGSYLILRRFIKVN